MRLLNPKQIWAVGGGKGGVGKSFITGNLGAMLAQRGYRVVLVDMDLGGANLHTWLGVNNPDRGVSEFVGHFVENVDQLLIPTGINNLSLISGARDGMEIANLKHTQKLRFLRALQRLEADCVLLDLGAGTAYNTIDFFLLADTHLLIVVPEPTSIENAYRFIKNSFYRKLRSDSSEQGFRNAVEQLLLLNNPQGIRTPKDLINYMRRQGGGTRTLHRAASGGVPAQTDPQSGAQRAGYAHWLGDGKRLLQVLWHPSQVFRTHRTRGCGVALSAATPPLGDGPTQLWNLQTSFRHL